VRLVEIDAHINDPGFVRAACELLLEQVGANSRHSTAKGA
jgi:uncharacterized protein (UPF0261 family)